METPISEYPSTKRVSARKTLHGTVVEDDYQWLENTSDAEVQDWIQKQNRFAESFLKGYPGRTRVEQRLRELLSFDDITRDLKLEIVKTEEGLRFFFLLRRAEEIQAKLYYQDGEKGDPIELVNPLDISPEGLVTIDWFYPSHDGELVAYGLSKDG
ncbi:MAG: hypothetical protein ACFFB3_20475, partial [Candidatus Hodarchaeota archaeon]